MPVGRLKSRWRSGGTEPDTAASTGPAAGQYGAGTYPHIHRLGYPLPPDPHPPLPPPVFEREGWVDNQRNTLYTTPRTVQPNGATARRGQLCGFRLPFGLQSFLGGVVTSTRASSSGVAGIGAGIGFAGRPGPRFSVSFAIVKLAFGIYSTADIGVLSAPPSTTSVSLEWSVCSPTRESILSPLRQNRPRPHRAARDARIPRPDCTLLQP